MPHQKTDFLLRKHVPCDGPSIALNNLDNARNYLGTCIGIVFVLLGRCILDGKPGVSGRGTSPASVFHRDVND